MYECKECQKRFNHASGLNAHIKTHTREKPYSCDECGKCFTHKHHLKIHLVIHSGEKMYECQECQKRFNQASNLNRHKKNTHKDQNLTVVTSVVNVLQRMVTEKAI